MDDILPFETVAPLRRRQLLQQEPHLVWLTGLSGAGKTTLARRLEADLADKGYKTFLLDGDTLRKGLNSDLGFSEEDRRENIRRAAEVAALLLEAGLVVVAAFISPFAAERRLVRQRVGIGRFTEVYVNAPLSVCEDRDVKGLYKKARSGALPQFTGIGSPYEVPAQPDVEVCTDRETPEASLQKILALVEPLLQPVL